MTFEVDELERLRQTTSKILLAALWVHVPIAIIFGISFGVQWVVPASFMVAVGLAATASWRTDGNGPSTRLVFAVALMADVSMFVFQFSGHPWQADMHMYFFVALACLVAYCDFRPIIAGTAAVALHHLILNFILPAAVYPGGSDLGRAVLHAVILLIEAGVLIWLAHTLSHLFETAAQKTAEAEAASAAEARANADRTQDEKAKADSDAARRELSAGFERKISDVVQAVAVAATQMQELSASMNDGNVETMRQTAAAAATSTRASANVETIASATAELTASINKIAEQVTRSALVAAKAAEEARRTNTVVEGLATGTRSGDADPKYCEPDQSLGLERDHRGRARRRARPGICGGRKRGQGAGQSDRQGDGGNFGPDSGHPKRHK
jgi:methyl-accepting chemotaxis protein